MLSDSDVVEVIGADGESTYNFCDPIGFRRSFSTRPHRRTEKKKNQGGICEPGKVQSDGIQTQLVTTDNRQGRLGVFTI